MSYSWRIEKNLNSPWEATFELLATQEHQFRLAGKSKQAATILIFAIDFTGNHSLEMKNVSIQNVLPFLDKT